MPDAWDPGCEPVRVAIDPDRDPGAVLRALRGDRLPFALIGSWAGGGAIIGSEPVAVRNGAEVLAAPQPPCDSAPEGFVGGGWVGYLGFGLGWEIERLPPPPPRPWPLALGQLAFYDHVLHLDAAGCWWLEALSPAALTRALVRVRARLARAAPAHPWRLSALRPAGAGSSGHRQAVAECVERIAAGELFQANVCLRLEGRFDGSPLDAFVVGSERLRPSHGAYLSLADGALLSFSPELFLRRRGRLVETAPIKGTLPRVGDLTLAREARDRLAASAKDAAEHVMIVDLMRNDLGRVARYGTVVADSSPRVEPHPGLWHLVTTVAAELRPEVTDQELLRATFPPGSVTGAPKVQALKVIAELEGTAREAYTGAIGILSPVSGLELSVAIRTLELRGSAAWLGCGGGIVADSDPAQELREALDKAAPIAAALDSAIEEPDRAPSSPGRTGARLARRPDPGLGLYETLRVRDGRPVDLDAHLARLAAGLETGYGVPLPRVLRSRVLDAAALAGRSARLRIVVRPEGDAIVETAPSGGAPAPLLLEPVTVAGGLGDRKLADREPLLAFESEGRAGLICDLDGEVLEATSANVWALLDGGLVTPPLDGRILPGVTRAAILRLGEVAGIRVSERRLTLAELQSAAAILVSSSVRISAAASLVPTAGDSSSLTGPGPESIAVRLAALIRATLDQRTSRRLNATLAASAARPATPSSTTNETQSAPRDSWSLPTAQ